MQVTAYPDLRVVSKEVAFIVLFPKIFCDQIVPMRIPTHRGHRSDAKRDTIPTRSRTLFRAEGGHGSELIRDTFPNLVGADSVRSHPAGARSDAGESPPGILLPLPST